MATPAARTGSTAVRADDRRLTLALYATAVFLFWFSQYVYIPTLPTYVQSKTTNLAVVGVVLSMYGLWQGIVRVPLGIAVDWAGWRKPFILVGLALAGVGAWTMATSINVEGVAVGRAITGLSTGAWVPLIVAFSGLFPPREAVRASALLTLFNSVGRILATTMTGPLNEWGGYSMPFLVATGVSALAVFSLLPLREEHRTSHAPSVGGIRQLLRRRDLMLPSALGAVQQYVNWAISFGFMVVLVKALDGNSMAQSAVVTVHIAMTALGNLLATCTAHRLGAKRLVYLSFVSLAAGTACAALSTSLPMLFVAPVFLGLGIGIGYPVLMGLSIQNIADAERTTAMGLHQSIYAIGMFVGPAVSGAIADAIGIQPMFAATAAACLVLGMLGTRFIGASSGEPHGVPSALVSEQCVADIRDLDADERG